MHDPLKKMIMILNACLGFLPVLYAQSRAVKGKGTHSLQQYKGYHARDSVKLTWTDTMPTQGAINGFVVRGVCKGFSMRYPKFVTAVPFRKDPIASPLPVTPPLLKVTGNILYDVNYRSRLDTPYAANNLYQHTVQTHLDVLYKGQYPMRIYLTTRFSNSPLFRRYTDLNFQYNQNDFARIIRQRIMNAVTAYVLSQTKEVDSLNRLLEQKRASFLSLSQSLEKPSLAQQTVEARERAMLNNRKPFTPADTLSSLPAMENMLRRPGQYKFVTATEERKGGDEQPGDTERRYAAAEK